MPDEMAEHLIDWFSQPIESISDDERESALQILRRLRESKNADMGPLVKFANEHPTVGAELRIAAYKKGISFIENEIAEYKKIKAGRELTPEEHRYGEALRQLLDSTSCLITSKLRCQTESPPESS